MSNQDYLSELMGFDPTQLSVFQEPVKSSTQSIIYKPNPSLSKSEDGHYRASLRIVYNPHDKKESIVKSLRYNCKDDRGFFTVNSSLVNGDKNCPMFKAWKQLWFAKSPDGKSEDPVKKEWAKIMFDRSESQWVIVQIIRDENQPELVGQFKVMKLPRAIYNRLTAKMNPSAESKKTPVKVLDYVIGLELEMDVIPGPADAPYRVSYDSCDFQGVMPIINVDGTPLFTDEELETIENFSQHNDNYYKAKTENTRKKEAEAINALKPALLEFYQRAKDVVDNNAPDLVKECGYRPWTEEETARVNKWISHVLRMENPEISDVFDSAQNEPGPVVDAPKVPSLPETFVAVADDSPYNDVNTYDEVQSPTDDLPF